LLEKKKEEGGVICDVANKDFGIPSQRAKANASLRVYERRKEKKKEKKGKKSSSETITSNMSSQGKT